MEVRGGRFEFVKVLLDIVQSEDFNIETHLESSLVTSKPLVMSILNDIKGII